MTALNAAIDRRDLRSANLVPDLFTIDDKRRASAARVKRELRGLEVPAEPVMVVVPVPNVPVFEAIAEQVRQRTGITLKARQVRGGAQGIVQMLKDQPDKVAGMFAGSDFEEGVRADPDVVETLFSRIEI